MVLLWYLIGINLLALLLCGIDKRRAVRGKWRIREAVLLGVSAAAGAAGMLAGMRLFHHKTRKPAFRAGVPALLLVWAAVLLLLYHFRAL